MTKTYSEKAGANSLSVYQVGATGVAVARDFPDGLVDTLTVAAPISTPEGAFKQALLRIKEKSLGWSEEFRLPGQNIYLHSYIAGSLSCYREHFVFDLSSNSSRFLPAPQNWNTEEGGGCMVERKFGAVAGRPAAIELDGSSDGLRRKVSVALWADDHFGPACTAEFRFAPAFIPAPNNACHDDDCNVLMGKALSIVKQAQQSPRLALSDATDNLPENQLAAFADWLHNRQLIQQSSDDPMSVDENHPLYIPLLFQDRLWVATMTHPTMTHSLTSPNWDVEVQQIESQQKYEFSFDMRPGRWLNATVR